LLGEELFVAVDQCAFAATRGRCKSEAPQARLDSEQQQREAWRIKTDQRRQR